MLGQQAAGTFSTSDCSCSNACTIVSTCTCRSSGKLVPQNVIEAENAAMSWQYRQLKQLPWTLMTKPPILENKWDPTSGYLIFTSTKKMINDCYVADGSAAEQLLKKQFPTVDGLFEPLIGASPVGFAATTGSTTVQIHNTKQFPWVMSAATYRKKLS